MRTVTAFDDTAARRLEAVYHTPDIAGQRREVLRVLDPRPGEAVLDVGSGPGILLGELAERVHPGGRATGIDLSESMLALAGKRRHVELRLSHRRDPGSLDCIAVPAAEAGAQRLVEHRLPSEPPDHDRGRDLTLAEAGHSHLASELASRFEDAALDLLRGNLGLEPDARLRKLGDAGLDA